MFQIGVSVSPPTIQTKVLVASSESSVKFQESASEYMAVTLYCSRYRVVKICNQSVDKSSV
jgi:hypothetical protein